ncbi:hypothetical protein [Streptomyces globosus]|uniref:hypothetical protein n=1 Tax=Streptomyces globosus TaxID=68209 RepID=UPI003640AC2E
MSRISAALTPNALHSFGWSIVATWPEGTSARIITRPGSWRTWTTRLRGIAPSWQPTRAAQSSSKDRPPAFRSDGAIVRRLRPGPLPGTSSSAWTASTGTSKTAATASWSRRGTGRPAGATTTAVKSFPVGCSRSTSARRVCWEACEAAHFAATSSANPDGPAGRAGADDGVQVARLTGSHTDISVPHARGAAYSHHEAPGVATAAAYAAAPVRTGRPRCAATRAVRKSARVALR